MIDWRPVKGTMSRKHKGRQVSGWLCLDKAVGLTSTGAVGSIKRLFGAAKVGHAGTLDPLASGVLPIALGDATRTVPFVQDGRKVYRFTVRWGEETDTDDADGTVAADERPAPRCRGDPRPRCPASPARSCSARRPFPPSRSPASAPMTSPARARRWCSRSGRSSSIAWRSSTPRIATTRSSRPNAARAPMSARSPAISAAARLPRPRRGAPPHGRRPVRHRPRRYARHAHRRARGRRRRSLDRFLMPIAVALCGLPEVALAANDAARIRRGQPVLMRGPEAPFSPGGPCHPGRPDHRPRRDRRGPVPPRPRVPRAEKEMAEKSRLVTFAFSLAIRRPFRHIPPASPAG